MKLRLWINRDGTPLYVETVEGEMNANRIEQIKQELADLRRSGDVGVLSSEWEVRVLA